MVFRQSVELSFKIIYLNNKHIKTEEDISVCAEELGTHDLIKLLKLIEPFISNSDFYNFLKDLSSFISFNENMDPSFSRYILNRSFDINKL